MVLRFLSAAVLALGTVAWPAIGAALKLTLAPLVFIGIQRRGWWLAAGIAVVAALPFGELWRDYAVALANAASERGIVYALGFGVSRDSFFHLRAKFFIRHLAARKAEYGEFSRQQALLNQSI